MRTGMCHRLRFKGKLLSFFIYPAVPGIQCFCIFKLIVVTISYEKEVNQNERAKIRKDLRLKRAGV